MNSYLYLLLLILLSVAPPPYAAAQTISDSTAEDPFSNVSPSIAILITVLVSAFFVAGFFSLFLRNCSDDTADGANSLYTYTAAGTRTRRLSVSGLDPAAIESFPIFKYAEIKNLKIGRGALTCAVCVTEFEDDESLRLLPKCDHVFHPECIDAWLASHSTCPICRANLTEATEKTQSTEVRSSGSELSEVRNQSQISITVDGNQRVYPETSDREGVTTFPRSNSTGHSLVQLGEDCERYTLRLPEEVRRRVERFDRVGRSDQRCLYMTPPFFSRTGSVTSAKVGVVDVEETAVGTSKLFLTSVESPFDCLGSKSEEMSSRLPV